MSLQFPSQIFANSQAQGVILFKTKNADLAAARFDVVQAASFPPLSFPVRSAEKEGSFGFTLQAAVPQHVVLQAVLIDHAGRESKPVRFSFDVAPAPVTAPAAGRRRSGPRGIEIQAPNGFRFRLPR